MTSLMTNVSAQIALQTLRTVNDQLEDTNTRVSTGLRINSAKDGAAYWSIATTTRSDNGALGAVKDAIGIGKSSVDTATTGLNASKDTLDKIKNLLVAAQVPDNDRKIIQQQIGDLLSTLKGNADTAVSSGTNWISVDSSLGSYNATKSVVGSFSRNGDAVSTQTIEIDTSTMKLYDADVETHSTVDGFHLRSCRRHRHEHLRRGRRYRRCHLRNCSELCRVHLCRVHQGRCGAGYAHQGAGRREEGQGRVLQDRF
jgi:flagellin